MFYCVVLCRVGVVLCHFAVVVVVLVLLCCGCGFDCDSGCLFLWFIFCLYLLFSAGACVQCGCVVLFCAIVIML